MNYLNLLNRVVQARMFRRNGFPRPHPLSLACTVTTRCMAHCKTCDITSQCHEEMTPSEYERLFQRLREKPVWITLSGGEPFLRDDLADIVDIMARLGRPDFLTIPTNGYLEDVVPRAVSRMAKAAPDTRFIIHVSIDGIGRAHDEIRGLPDSFDRAMFTLASLRNLNLPNLTVGVHTVISRFNEDRIPDILRYIREFRPDAHHLEIAWPRRELNMQDADIAPAPERYAEIARMLGSTVADEPAPGAKAIMRALRREYYRLSIDAYQSRRQMLPCYSGFASAHILPDATVAACCTRCVPFGNLRDENFNFHRVWTSPAANAERAAIRRGDCWCLLANAAYTNIMCDLGLARRELLRQLTSA